MDSPTDHGPVELREIDVRNLLAVLRLTVAPEQDGLVAPNAYSVAQYHDASGGWMRAIYQDDEPVGFAMLGLEEAATPYPGRFMVDARHQGRGVGRRALELLIEHVATLPDAEAFPLSFVEQEGSPRGCYEKLGFRTTGEYDGGEAVMRLELVPRTAASTEAGA